MKYLKLWWSDGGGGGGGGGLLHLTILLSLAVLHLDVELDLYLLLPPPALLWDELLFAGSRTNLAYALSSFPASEGCGRADHLHPKGRELDPAAEPEGQLLREVRALGVPFIPRTRVDAWLVHSVAAGDADGAHGLFGAAAAAASSAGGVGASADGGSQAAPGVGGDPRASPSSPLAAGEEEKAPAELTAQVPDASGGASERHLNGTDISFSLEDFFQLFSSQPENSEGISLGDTLSFPGNINDGMNSAQNVNFSQAISHDVNLHEAMLLCPNTSFRRDPTTRSSQLQAPFLQLNAPNINLEQTLPGTNLTGFLPLCDHQMRNLTSQDLYDLDINIFDEINLMSLATEGFDPMEVSHLFEPDSGLSLNSSCDSTSITKSNSSVCVGAIGSSSDSESLFHHALEGAVGGCCPEPSKLCHMEHGSGSGLNGDLAFQHIFHNHTYHLQPSTPEPTPASFSWPGKSQKVKRMDDTDSNLSRDERRAKALHIPFSVDEIVCTPVDSFNSMLSRYYLTDLQVSLIRDIRRRGKNKVAAQNCRKRKLDILLNLEDDICNLQAKKETLKREGAQCNKAIKIMKQKLQDLYHDIFTTLQDEEGRPVNPNQYTLQCTHDGSIWVVPKELVTSAHKKEKQKAKRNGDRS